MISFRQKLKKISNLLNSNYKKEYQSNWVEEGSYNENS